MASIIHILKSQPGDEALIERADAYIESLETDSGEPLLYEGSETTPGGMTMRSWREQTEGGAVVEIIDDPASATRSLNVEAAAREICERLAEPLGDRGEAAQSPREKGSPGKKGSCLRP
jgi:hypothetical protein